MIWLRNVLFIGLVCGGVIALGANLMPPREPTPITKYDVDTYRDIEFVASVARVDNSFRDQWKKEAIQPVAVAPDLLVARRLSLGLMGTVPSLEEIRQLEALPPQDRLPWWLDHILHDRRFADYFAERFARATVGTEDGPFILYRRRRYVSWLSDELAKNQPYDHIVRDMIAGEGLWTDKPATNFISVTLQNDNDKKNVPNPVRLAGRVTRAFLGLRLDCAECHNHPFSSWKKRDFEGFSAFFGQTHVGMTGIYDGPGEYEVEDRKTQEKSIVAPHVPFAEDLLPSTGTRRQQLAAWVTHAKNPYFAKATVNRVWALMTGKPLADPIDNLETETPIPAALQFLADDFVTHNYDLQRLIRVIASSGVFRLASESDREIGEAEEKAWAIFPLTRLRPEQVSGSVLQAASVTTSDSQAYILLRLMRFGQQNTFLQRYGDSGEDEFDNRGGTIPQRLLLMNGELVRERIKENPINASSRISFLAPDDPRALEVSYLATLTRRPTPAETAYFEAFLRDPELKRAHRLEDIFWTLINATEFSWNH